MAGTAGVEPTTNRLTADCSTSELCAHIHARKEGFEPDRPSVLETAALPSELLPCVCLRSLLDLNQCSGFCRAVPRLSAKRPYCDFGGIRTLMRVSTTPSRWRVYPFLHKAVVPRVGLEQTRLSSLVPKTSVATVTPPGQIYFSI